ncbi:MAG: histidyl-tRNA synthetase [Bradymonadia bacterium]|jgi:histidyl-tRNA synthetase
MAVSTKPASGTRDFLPSTVKARRLVTETIRKTYEAYGFVPLETPAIERIEVLTGKYGDEGDQLMFKLVKRGQKLPALTEKTQPNDLVDMALRYDLTVPLARVVAANHGTLPRFFKRYQIQPVWRADRPQKGRFREFYQCDVDFMGTTSVMAEATVISAVAESLGKLGFDKFDIVINDRRVLTGLMEVAGVAEEMRTPALVMIDKLDKIGADGVKNELSAAGLSQASIDVLSELVLEGATSLDDVEAAFESASEIGAEGAETLRTLFGLLKAAPIKAGTALFDVSLARGLSYYTGPIFEIRVEGLSGSMGGGGRYDGLIGMFRGNEIPAVGFSLGLERILVVMEDRGMLSDTSTAPDLYVAMMDDVMGSVLSFCSQAREGGLTVDAHPQKAKLGKQLAYAEALGTKWVAIIGEREADAGNVSLKNLDSGDQQTLSWADAVAAVAAEG